MYRYDFVADAETAAVKYIFLDVVSFTMGRSVEAQTEIVASLNGSVNSALRELSIPSERCILIPTGDGLCIALIGVDTPYDIQILTATAILRNISSLNQVATDEMRRFNVRIGINENIDNVITDINGQRNVAGAGISLAARIMDLADSSQVLVSHAVYERLRHRQNYMASFVEFWAVVKHGEQFAVYQYREPSGVVNNAMPRTFRMLLPNAQRLSAEVAFYMAHALAHRQFLLKHRELTDNVPTSVLLWLRAVDSMRNAQKNETQSPQYHTHGSPTMGIDEQYEYYRRAPWSLLAEIARLITVAYLRPCEEFFDDRVGYGWRFVNAAGAEKLKTDWPSIWLQFNPEQGSPK